MSDADRQFHEQWIGMAQPIEGLVVSVPTLIDAQCGSRLPLTARDRWLEIGYELGDGEAPRFAVDLEALLFHPELLGFRRDDFDGGEALPEELALWVPEGRQRVVPSRALKRKKAPPPGPEATPAQRAGAAYELLIWQLPDGLDLDRSETVTGTWEYPPTRKFERLLRHCRVTAGVIANGEALRLVVAPHGESSGWLTFRAADLATAGGRPLLDALVMLLGRKSFFSRAPEARLGALLRDSRKRQADVTEELAEQVFRALEILLAGFEAAAERDGSDGLEDARRLGGDHLYGGLLTVLLRLVFLLYAEDRGLVPVEHELYADSFSVLGLFDELQADAGEFPDSMDRRFGAWDRLLALFRAVWVGVEHRSPGREGPGTEDFVMPARGGRLFDPNRYPFLEGWPRGGSAPLKEASARAVVRVPSIDDGMIYEVLRHLVIFEGQRLSYRALDVEQIGSVYEALMGYHVVKVMSPAICLRSTRAWVESGELLAAPRRPAFLQEQAGLARAEARKVAAALKGVEDEAATVAALEPYRRRGTVTARAGRLVLQPGAERRRTSSHYTPRSLSEPIVRRTLEPLLLAMGPEPESERLLELKICDPAMGSGAFLVEACRSLADEVVAAWTREGRLELVASAHEDVVNHARRLVAQRCLYGVDKNPFAVDLAKLSLWLETLARDLPFTFLDHALRCGDSLVGLDFAQIRGFHWSPDGQQNLASRALEEALSEAIGLRQQILDLAGEGAGQQQEKERLLRDADDALDHARLIGDLVVGAFFSSGKEKERRLELGRRLALVNEWLEGDGGTPPEELVEMRREIRGRVGVFHWMLEFPEVFYAERPDPLDDGRANRVAFFDTFVGNPPFAGKNQIAASQEASYPDWLKTIHTAAHGNADLSAHFFRRANVLLGRHGTIGLIATNTIAQGDTRATGLQPLAREGLEIYDAKRSMPWPGTAAVTVAVVHLAKGSPAKHTGQHRLDDKVVEAVNSRLRGKPERDDPERLVRNRDLSFQGSIVLGMGFTLTPEERAELIAREPRNAERIFPYIGGAEVNSSPTQSHNRYVISFGKMSLEKAEQWPDLIEIVREKVKPERDRNKRPVRRDYWWRFAELASGLYTSIESIDRCLLTLFTSKYLTFSFSATDRIFANTLWVIPIELYSAFAVLQSRLHEPWARLLSSSLEDRLRYAATDCFETFPFPHPDPRTEIPELEPIGQTLYEKRAQYLVDTDQGLTACYNRLKDPHDDDPRVAELRRLHEDMDRAVLAAYGWPDVAVPPYATPEDEAGRRALEAFEDEVLDRLFVLNAERAAEERRLGLAAALKGKGKTKKKAARKKKRHAGQGGLFD